jgi:hypothetical protein
MFPAVLMLNLFYSAQYEYLDAYLTLFPMGAGWVAGGKRIGCPA